MSAQLKEAGGRFKLVRPANGFGRTDYRDFVEEISRTFFATLTYEKYGSIVIVEKNVFRNIDYPHLCTVSISEKISLSAHLA